MTFGDAVLLQSIAITVRHLRHRLALDISNFKILITQTSDVAVMSIVRGTG